MKSMWKRLKLWVKPDYIGWLFIILGTVLRLRQYLADRSLWHDEANLALNLVNRTFGGLTQPLDYEQGAPIGFLLIEKSILVLLGNKDYILRLFPLISGLLALYLIYLVARRYFGTTGLFAVLVFAISWSLIYYSSELKQYSSDALFALLLIYLAFRCFDKRERFEDFLLLGVTGLIAIWTSHPSAFILAGIGLTLIFDKLNRKAYTPLAWTLGLGVLWTSALAAVYFVSLRYLTANSFLQDYWRHAFMPLPPWSNLDWFGKTYLSLMGASLGFDSLYLVILCSALGLIGVVSLSYRNRNIAMVILLPFGLALIAAALQEYPLDDRFMLFLVPLFILLMAEGLSQIYLSLQKSSGTMAVIFFACIALLTLWMPVYDGYRKFLAPPMGEDIKPVLQYVVENQSPNDLVYVEHGARPAFAYYAASYGLNTGNVITGTDFNGKPTLQKLYNSAKQLRGNNRVWFIFTNVDCVGCQGDAEGDFVQYLNQIGRQENSFHAQGADVYLYNLNP